MINKTVALDSTYKDCVSAALPLAKPPTHDLILSRVQIHRTSDCFGAADKTHTDLVDNLICASEMTSDNYYRIKEGDATRVLICSSNQTNQSR